MKALQPVIASNGVPYLLMRSVGSHSTLGMEKEGNKEIIGFVRWLTAFSLMQGRSELLYLH